MNSIALNTKALREALAARVADGGQISEVFLVACGGSLVDLYPARFFLASESRRLRTDLYTANEFVHAVPKVLGDRSVVIICSHVGATPESKVAANLWTACSRNAEPVILWRGKHFGGGYRICIS